MSNYQPYIPAQETPPGWPPGEYQRYGTQPVAAPTQSGQPAPAYSPTTSAYPQPMAPYSQAVYPMVAVRPEHPQATAVLVLGILGFFVPITGLIAWVLGNKGRRECASGMYVETDPLRIGRILGIVTTILMIIGIILVAVYMIALFAMFATYR